jgi:flagellar hook-length control protein FliK
MNAVSPALPAAAPNPTAGAPGSAPTGNDTEGGFADALQQARQGARAREARPERKAAEARAPARSETRTTPAEAPTDDAAPRAAEAATTDTTAGPEATLPPWLEHALARAESPLPEATSPASPVGAEAAQGLAGRHDAEPIAADPAAVAAAIGGAPTDTAARAARMADASADARDTAALDELAGPAWNDRGEPAAATPTPPMQAPTSAPFSLAAVGAAEAVDRPLATPLHSPAFAPALGAQLNLLVKEGITEARLHLNPAEMGPITVQIQVDGTTARVEMAAEHAVTRQVLEQAMPVLAGALRETGLTLTGGGVFEQARDPRQGDAEAGPGRGSGAGSGPGGGTAADVEPARPVQLPRGVVDVYA